MRISSAYFSRNMASELMRQQSEIARLQEQISSGKRINKPSDDPALAARSLQVKDAVAQLEQFDRNSTFAEQRLTLEESTLGSVSNVLQRLQELALQANSANSSPQTHSAFHAEVAQRLDELLDYANTTDSNGDYLYAGGQSRTKPFSLGNNVTHYAGDDQARLLQVGPERKVVTADNGIDVFMRIRDGNGDFSVNAAAGNTGTGVISNGSVKDHGLLTGDSYAIQFTSATTYDVVNTGSGAAVISGATYVPDDSILFDGMEVSINGTPAAGDSFAIAPSANQDLFATVRDFMQALQSNPANPAEQAKFRQDMNNVMSNLDQALDHLLARRSEVGTRLSYIDSSREENSAIQFQMDKTLAEIEGLDLAEAISQLQYQMTAMQALQQTFSRMEGLSLFNYLR